MQSGTMSSVAEKVLLTSKDHPMCFEAEAGISE